MRRLLFAAVLIVLTVAFASSANAEYHRYTLPLDGTSVNGSVRKGSLGDYDEFCFTLDISSRVRIKLASAETSTMQMNLNAGPGFYLIWTTDASKAGLYTLDLKPGDYSVMLIDRAATHDVNFSLSAVAEPLEPDPDMEPNDTQEKAVPLARGVVQNGYLSYEDKDVFCIDIETPSVVEFTVVRSDVNTTDPNRERVFDPDGRPADVAASEPALSGNDVTVVYTVKLPRGRSYFSLSPFVVYTGAYTISYDIVKPASDQFVIDKKSLKSVMLAGDWQSFSLKEIPVGFEDLHPSITISNGKVLELEAGYSHNYAGGFITALSPGKATLKIKTDRQVYKKTITVKPNSYSRSKPLIGKGRGLYVSHKRLEYKDGYLHCEVFLTNKTPQTIYRMKGIYGAVYDLYNEQQVSSIDLGVWEPAVPVRPGKTAVVKFRFTKDEVFYYNLNKRHYIASINVPYSAMAMVKGGRWTKAEIIDANSSINRRRMGGTGHV